MTFPFCSLNWINIMLYRRRRSKFSELEPNPFAKRSCNKICSNQINCLIVYYCKVILTLLQWQIFVWHENMHLKKTHTKIAHMNIYYPILEPIFHKMIMRTLPSPLHLINENTQDTSILWGYEITPILYKTCILGII